MGIKVVRPPGRKDWYLRIVYRGERVTRHVGSREAAFAAKKEIEAALAVGTFVLKNGRGDRGVTFSEAVDPLSVGGIELLVAGEGARPVTAVLSSTPAYSPTMTTVPTTSPSIRKETSTSSVRSTIRSILILKTATLAASIS